MKIDLTTLSDSQLADLVVAVTEEWRRRLPTTETQFVTAPARTIVVLSEPNDDDKDFCLGAIQLLCEKGFALASDRARYREIAKLFPDWIRSKRWPDDLGGAEARRWKESSAALDRARNRLSSRRP